MSDEVRVDVYGTVVTGTSVPHALKLTLTVVLIKTITYCHNFFPFFFFVRLGSLSPLPRHGSFDVGMASAASRRHVFYIYRLLNSLCIGLSVFLPDCDAKVQHCASVVKSSLVSTIISGEQKGKNDKKKQAYFVLSSICCNFADT